MQKGPLLGQGRTAEVYAWGEDRVLKLFFESWSSDWIEQEARVARIVHEAGLAAPAIEGTIELEGRSGIIYERIDGPSMMENTAFHPWRLGRAARQLADLHLAMHGLVERELPSGLELLTRLLREAPRLTDQARSWLLRHLERLPEENAICHGDFHPDNVLMSPRGPVVIDWMSVTRGHPLADVAGTLLLFSIAEMPESLGLLRGPVGMIWRAMLAPYLRHYFRSSPYTREQLENWIPVMAAAYLGQGMTTTEEDKLLAFIDAAVKT